MDVDLLRPGTAPMSPHTMLWFEFILDPHLLKKHLAKPTPDPSPYELIAMFVAVETDSDRDKAANDRVVDVDTPSSPVPLLTAPLSPQQLTLRELALKILCLKTAAALKWNLDKLEDGLAPQFQQRIILDLVYMATDGAYIAPPQEIPQEILLKPHVQFALTLYHRWNLRFPVKAGFNAKSTKLPFIHIPGMQVDRGYSPLNPEFEKILRSSESTRVQSIRFLEEILTFYESNLTMGRREPKKIKIPVMDTFVHLNEESEEVVHDWELSDVSISQYELAMQIHYDLCANYFFYCQYDLAKKHILLCKENYQLLEREMTQYRYHEGNQNIVFGEFNYASFPKEDIFGYIKALNLGYEILGEVPNLQKKLQESIANHYAGIIALFQTDNIVREIPLSQRQVVELDIQAAASSGAFTVARDLLTRVSVLNAVRYILEGGIPTTHPEFFNKMKTVGIKFYDLLFWALAPVLVSNLSDKEWENLNIFFLHLLISPSGFPIERFDEYLRKYVGDAADRVKIKLIHDDDIARIVNDSTNFDDENIDLPRELLTDDWETPDFEYKSVPELELGRLKKRLIESSTADDVRMCLVKLAMMAPASPLWKLSPSWKPAGGLASALVALPRGFLQDFGYVVSGAARARAETGSSRTALSLVSVLEGETRGQLGNGSDPTLYRLSRLLSWEVLFLQVNVMLNEWPHHRQNLTALASKCKACIAVATSGDTCIPRSQIIEACWVCLVNACEWESGAAAAAGAGVASGSGTVSGVGEAAAALCIACSELQRGKAARKLPRQLWDYGLSAFANNPTGASKRNAGGMPMHSRDLSNATIEARNQLSTFLSMLREPLAVTLICSLLAKIYNVLVDDSTVDLTVEYINLWPANISNVNNYNIKYVLESLTVLLERSLKLYPSNTSWLRLYGDVEAAAGRPGAAMRRYVCALAANSWYFAKRAPDEGAISRRMARCSQALNTPTQAVALCQLPEEPDYTTALKWLVEKNGNATDAMDSLYSCIWDGTLLEVTVAAHARRGEAGRRTRAVRAAGAIELNSNNSEDIAREAAATRRSRLLRALTNQYVM